MKLKEAANSNLWIILKIFFTCICKMNKINKMNFCWIKCQQLLDINTRIELKHDANKKNRFCSNGVDCGYNKEKKLIEKI